MIVDKMFSTRENMGKVSVQVNGLRRNSYSNTNGVTI